MTKLVNIEDYRKAAKRRLPKPIFDYLDGGADDEWSLRNNTSAFEKYELWPRQLNDVSNIDLKTRLLGTDFDCPVFLSPTGMTRLFHHHKEFGVARAASQTGFGYSLSTMGTARMEDIAAICKTPKIYQLYIHKDRGLTREFVERAKAANYDALCLTVDTATAGNRERDARNGFEVPPRLTLGGLASFALHPYWTFHFLREHDFRFVNVARRVDAMSDGALGVMRYINSQLDSSLSWDDAAAIIADWGGPFIIKGVQSADDAARAVEIGASALMLSNHGGRQLESAPAPVDCVRPIRERIGEKLELIVDGGVRRPGHVIKALCLGANAVSFGRPYLYALAAGGEAEVKRFLTAFKEGLKRDMALLGCASVSALGERYLKPE